MSILLKTAVWAGGWPLARQLEAAATNPQATQMTFLQRLLARNADTIFGREHGFDRIRTAADYRRVVPVADYERLRPYVNRLLAGESNILTASPPLMFARTSGTTGQPKYIPITRESEAGGSRLMRQWLYRALQDRPRFLDRATLGIVSPGVEGYVPCGLPYGSVSGRIYQQIPAVVQRSYAVPYPVFEIKDYDARYFAIARFALTRSLSFISTPNPSTLIRLANVIATQTDRLIRAIHDGNLGVDAGNLTAALQPFLKPQPRRARQLARIVQQFGTLRPQDCWPELQLLGCWTGGSAGLQAQHLAAHFGPVPLRDLGYLASEARITLPLENNTAAGLLALTENYYEFVPEAAVDDANPPVLGCHELEVGQRYSLLLTTAAGLYRYCIHDIVEVTGFYRATPLLAFARKGKDMSNLVGEKLHANHVMLAMDQVQQRYGLSVLRYTLQPNDDATGYALQVELTEDAPTLSPDWWSEIFAPAFERALAAVNLEYGQKRNSHRLSPVTVQAMPAGWSETAIRQAIAQGKRDVQFKWPVLRSHQGIAGAVGS